MANNDTDEKQVAKISWLLSLTIIDPTVLSIGWSFFYGHQLDPRDVGLGVTICDWTAIAVAGLTNARSTQGGVGSSRWSRRLKIT